MMEAPLVSIREDNRWLRIDIKWRRLLPVALFERTVFEVSDKLLRGDAEFWVAMSFSDSRVRSIQVVQPSWLPRGVHIVVINF